MTNEYNGSMVHRRALQAALQELNDRGVSDEKIKNSVLKDKKEGRIPDFPAASKLSLSRPTIQRIRNADDGRLAGLRHSTLAMLYGFLCQSEELKTSLYDEKTRIHSAHPYAPVLEMLRRHFVARRNLLGMNDLRSLEGTFHLYRKAWTTQNYDTYIRCVLRFEWVGDALFYKEEQQYVDPIAKIPVEETDSGVVMPYGMNVVLLGHGKAKDIVKFFSLHDFFPYPDGIQRVHTITGNFIAVYSKGPHPGFRAFAQRVEEGDASSAFYGVGELDSAILEKLSG